MPKPWAQVASSPEFRALPAEQQEAARQQYFAQVVAPQIGDPAQVEAARAQFDQQTKTHQWQPRKRTVDDLRQAARVHDATDGMNPVEVFFAGAGKSLVDTGRGVKQLYHMGLDKVAPRQRTTADLITGRDPSRQAQDRIEQDAIEERDGSLMGNGYGLAGNITGNVAQVLSPGVVLKGAAAVPQLARAAPVLNAASRASLPRTVRGAAAQGGVLGALQPVGTQDSRVGNAVAGTAFGAGGAAAPRLLGAGYRAARDAITMPTMTGAQRAAVKTIREMVDNPDALMVPNPSTIPGVQRTLYDETLIPSVARLETKARGAHGDHWTALDAANAKAREAALRTFAKDEGAVDAAIAARKAATDPLYNAANKVQGVDTSRLISQIKRLEAKQEGREAIQNGLAKVRSLLTREIPDAERIKAAIKPLQDFIASDRTSATNREAAKAAIAQIRRGEWPTGTFGNGGPGTLGVGASSDAARDALAAARKALERTHEGHNRLAVIGNVRKTIGDMLSGKYGGDNAAALAGSRELIAVRDQLDRVAAKYSPEFAQANQTFRSMSGDINRMQAGQALIEKTTGGWNPLLGDYPLMPGKFSQNVKGLNRLVQSATGFRKATAEKVFTPQDLATIKAVEDDLARSGSRLSAGTGGGGSHTASQAEVGIKLAVKGLVRKAPWIGPWLEHMDAAGQQRVMSALSDMLANPAEYRRVAARLPAQESRKVEEAFFRLSSAAGAAVVPAAE